MFKFQVYNYFELHLSKRSKVVIFEFYLMKICFVFAAFLFSFFCTSQRFVVIDDVTDELIESVNFQLLLNGTVVSAGITSNEEPTVLSGSIVFDSLVFRKADYKIAGLKKENLLEVIKLSKTAIGIEEVVILSAKDKEVVFGEKNSFIKRRSRPILNDLSYGIVFENNLPEDVEINRVEFFVEKVRYRTAYQISFYDFDIGEMHNYGRQSGSLKELLYSSAILYLEPKQKNAIQIQVNDLELPRKSMFVTIELINYFDEKGEKIFPTEDDRTRIKFQCSKLENYFSKWSEFGTNNFTGLVNTNSWIRYDIEEYFKEKLSKSSVVSPAILLYGSKIPSKKISLPKLRKE